MMRELLKRKGHTVEVYTAREPVDTIFVDYSVSPILVLFAEVKSAPLLTPALVTKQEWQVTKHAPHIAIDLSFVEQDIFISPCVPQWGRQLALFPAYPYLALNGPKNSGKSTVLRLLQPLAFNMITTSDPTGASMFRLIHQTGCTVGIDEAERYHNPKDPAMMQIRQLLNSGYKHGMPAIRLIGEAMKPQTFDVYSPKILAAIMGLEDVLASRCIAIPMRRTDKKMPSFAANFDGASLRHQLYSLTLTHFQPIFTNYFERPELHTLHNRSGELWSPLVALAAFFEEQGGIRDLLSAISDAAVWDTQWSEGQSLSDREEAVLQTLDLMTRHTSSLIWIRAQALRDQVAQLLGQTPDQLGHTQWIAHILKRLHLLDEQRRKRDTEGMIYAINPIEVQDMMRRYDVQCLHTNP